MLVLIRENVKNIPITQVTLSRDVDDPHGLRLTGFHCHRCGKLIAQYKGTVFSLMPGEGITELPVVIKCWSCQKHYAISAIV